MLRLLFLEGQFAAGLGAAFAALVALAGFEDLGVVGSVEDVAGRVGDAALGRVDVVVAGIDLGQSHLALELPRRLGPDGPPVVFLADQEEPSLVRSALLSGAAGLVHKEAPVEDLAQAVIAAAAGRTWFRRAGAATTPGGPDGPSRRELEVLRGVVAGLANKEIAGALGIEERTVESHLRRMMDRYAATNRTDLAVLGLREGWVSLPRGGGR